MQKYNLIVSNFSMKFFLKKHVKQGKKEKKGFKKVGEFSKHNYFEIYRLYMYISRE